MTDTRVRDAGARDGGAATEWGAATLSAEERAARLEALARAMPLKRAQILLAASDAFLDQGFGAATMDDIARRAQVSKATVYAHFASKAALFQALVASVSEVRLPLLFGGGPPGPVARALPEILARIADHVFTPRGLRLYRVVLAEADRFPELGQAFYAGGPGAVINGLAERLAQWAAEGHLVLADPRAAAEALYGQIKGDLHMRRLLGLGPVAGASEDHRALAARAAEAFLRLHQPAPPSDRLV